MFKKLGIAVLTASLSLPSLALCATYNRDQCLEMALSRNPMVLASIERKTQAELNQKAVYSDFLPKLNVDYSYTYLDKTNTIDASFLSVDEVSVSVHNNYRMGIYVDQPLFTGFRLTETYNLAKLGFKAAVAGEQLAGLEVTFQTLRAYYNFLMAQKFQKVADAAVAQLSSHLNDSEQFYKNEIIPLNNLLESKVYLANAQQDAKVAASRSKMARMNLAKIIKEPLNSPFTVEDNPDLTAIANPVEALTIQALQTRPELQQANYKYTASQKQITIAKSMYYPTIMATAAHNRYGSDPLVDGTGISDITNPEVSTIGVYATWELFAWGQTDHRINQANAASREANHVLTSVMDDISLEVQDNYIYAQTSFNNILTAKTAVKQAKENLRMAKLRYKNQIATNTEVLDAQTLLTDTETKYYQAIYHYNIGIAGLTRAVGVTNREQLAVQ